MKVKVWMIAAGLALFGLLPDRLKTEKNGQH